MLLRLTKEFSFEMAHALPAYEGKCHNIHGHSYKLFVTIEGTPLQQQGASTDGMVLDFGKLKAIVNEAVVDPFDHALLLPRLNPDKERLGNLKAGRSEGPQACKSPNLRIGKSLNQGTPQEGTLGGYAAKLLYIDFQPTTENLLLYFADLLADKMPQGARLHSLKLYETATSCAELII